MTHVYEESLFCSLCAMGFPRVSLIQTSLSNSLLPVFEYSPTMLALSENLLSLLFFPNALPESSTDLEFSRSDSRDSFVFSCWRAFGGFGHGVTTRSENINIF